MPATRRVDGPYRMSPKHALAQLAGTGCFNGTFYASAQSQLDELKSLANQLDDDLFLAKLAVYSREQAFMKDMPVALVALLASRDPQLFHKVFDRVIDNGSCAADAAADDSLRSVRQEEPVVLGSACLQPVAE